MAAVMKTGLFNPFTLNGTLVVNGVVASAHSDWFLDSATPGSLRQHLPATYQALMWPARKLFNMVGPDAARDFDDQYDVSELASDGSMWAYVYILLLATRYAWAETSTNTTKAKGGKVLKASH